MKFRTDISKEEIIGVIYNVLRNKSYLDVESYNLGTTTYKFKQCYDLYYKYWDELFLISKKNRKFNPNYDPVHCKFTHEERLKRQKERTHPKPNLGKSFSWETRVKMSKKAIGRKFTPEHKAQLGLKLRKPVLLLDDNGNILKRWDSIAHASRDNILLFHEQFIRHWLQGRTDHNRGYNFVLEEDWLQRNLMFTASEQVNIMNNDQSSN